MKLGLFFILLSCAKFSYLAEQGVGQVKLQWKGKKISKVLQDPKIAKEIKDKIKDIQKYKKFFYDYFSKDETSIYSKVTFLDNEAVTHLVIASYYDRVEPLKTSFPFAGTFPYLGFFKEKSAIKYSEKMRRKNYFTYKRPVYAYSTLGKLEDRILSSFFKYPEKGLAELIFHELFHTIFFIKSEVDLNENLANYFGKKMTKIYFKDNSNDSPERLNKNEKLRMKLVQLINEYKDILNTDKPKSFEDSESRLSIFLKTRFIPQVALECEQLEVSKERCYPLDMIWNNASFSAFMTYEKKGAFIDKLRVKKSIGSLKEYLIFIEKHYEIFLKQDEIQKFGQYLEEL